MIAQVEFVQGDFVDSIDKMSFNNSFDCFLACISNISCKTVARYHPTTNKNFTDCYLRNSTSTNNTKIQDAQYGKLLGSFSNKIKSIIQG